VLLYTMGRAMLWVVVLSAIYSMWGYFRVFFAEVIRGDRREAKASAPPSAVQKPV
jgi:hypothetical protein